MRIFCYSTASVVIDNHGSNLNNLTWLAETFGVEVGLSDHTTNNIAAVTAIGIGAVAIENIQTCKGVRTRS